MKAAKRFTWTETKMTYCLQYLVDNDALFSDYKKKGKLDEFYRKAGNAAASGGEIINNTMVENLLKNLGKEYRNELKERMTSGGETEEARPNPVLRNSEDMFQIYQRYYELYHKKGGPIRPVVIVTPGVVQRPGAETSLVLDGDGVEAPNRTSTPRSSPVPENLDTTRSSISMPTDLSQYSIHCDMSAGTSTRSHINMSPPKKRTKK